VERLAAYLSCLRQMQEEGSHTASSNEIGRRVGSNAAQVRKDLSYLGQFGRPGVGYDLPALARRISEVLGLSPGHRVVVVGIGSLGRALSLYHGFRREGFDICGLFDDDPAKQGRKLAGLEILPVEDLARRSAELKAHMGIIAVPAPAAQSVAEALATAGVTCILNFAPIRLDLPERVVVRNVDLTQELAMLSYYLKSRRP